MFKKITELFGKAVQEGKDKRAAKAQDKANRALGDAIIANSFNDYYDAVRQGADIDAEFVSNKPIEEGFLSSSGENSYYKRSHENRTFLQVAIMMDSYMVVEEMLRDNVKLHDDVLFTAIETLVFNPRINEATQEMHLTTLINAGANKDNEMSQDTILDRVLDLDGSMVPYHNTDEEKGKSVAAIKFLEKIGARKSPNKRVRHHTDNSMKLYNY